jgi:ABC-type polysaccharide transport system, permease component
MYASVFKKGFLHELKKSKLLFLMLIPSLFYFIIFNYLPMAGVYMAFSRYDFNKGIFGSQFLGLDNFRFLILSGRLFTVTRNTILYNLVFIIIGTAAQVTAAILMSEVGGKVFRKITQSIIFLPYFISYVIIGVFVYQVFNYEFGSFNNILKSLGMQPFDAYSTVSIWKYVLVFFYIWKNVGYGMIIYLAVIMSISNEYYEAAKIDGADVFQQIWHITLPMLKPTIIILFMFSIGSILYGQFELFYQIIGNNTFAFDSTDIIDTFVFRSLINQPDYGLVAAAGFYQSFFGFILIMIVNFIVKKLNSEYALF